MSVKPIPDGYHSLTPALTVRDAERAIEFYKNAFGATSRGGVMKVPVGKVKHAELEDRGLHHHVERRIPTVRGSLSAICRWFVQYYSHLS